MLGSDIAVSVARGCIGRHFDDLLGARRQIGCVDVCRRAGSNGIYDGLYNFLLSGAF